MSGTTPPSSASSSRSSSFPRRCVLRPVLFVAFIGLSSSWRSSSRPSRLVYRPSLIVSFIGPISLLRSASRLLHRVHLPVLVESFVFPPWSSILSSCHRSRVHRLALFVSLIVPPSSSCSSARPRRQSPHFRPASHTAVHHMSPCITCHRHCSCSLHQSRRNHLHLIHLHCLLAVYHLVFPCLPLSLSCLRLRRLTFAISPASYVLFTQYY